MTISRVDLTEANGYILEEQGSTVIQDLIANSAVERLPVVKQWLLAQSQFLVLLEMHHKW